PEGVRRGRVREDVERLSPDARQCLGDEPYIGGFIAFFPVRHWCEERRIGLQQEPVEGGDPGRLPARLFVPGGDDAPGLEVEPQVEIGADVARATREAMDDPPGRAE